MSDLFMNYMDYSPSSCKNMFTQGQVDRMMAQFQQYRTSFLEVTGCSFVGMSELAGSSTGLRLSPNPGSGSVQVWFTSLSPTLALKLTDAAGRVRLTRNASNLHVGGSLDITALGPGVYIVQVLDNNLVLGQERLVVL